MDANEDGKKEETEATECKGTTTALYMWGYLPGVSSEKSPMLSPVPVRLPDSVQDGESSWKDVCGGGCGFAMALSENGKLMTWGSAEEEGQSYVMCGRHGEIPEAITLPSEAAVVNAAAGWAHCVSVTESGEVYTWGWKECVPPAKFPRDVAGGGTFQKDGVGQPIASLVDQENKETIKKRKVSASAKDEYWRTAYIWLGAIWAGVKVKGIAAGLWHTVCVTTDGFIYSFGGNQFGQLGTGAEQGEIQPKLLDAPSLENRLAKMVSCGARHSAVLTEEGQVLCWGWNKYGQLGLGDSIDRNIPSLVPTESCQPKNVACGWWHTLLLAETSP